MAASAGNASIVNLLLQNKAEITSEDYQGNTPLHLASKFGHLGVIGLLLNVPQVRNKKLAVVNKKQNFEMSSLYLAALNGYLNVLKYLAKNGAHINAAAKFGDTLLHVVAAAAYPNAVKELLNYKADTNSVDFSNITPLHTAVLSEWYLGPNLINRQKVWKLNKTALQKCVQIIIDALLTKGGNINARDTMKVTPLHYAAHRNREILIQRLLEHGAEADPRNKVENTPLMLPAESGSPVLIR